ncbi:hypothetical protein [Treponema vincentii]|uniref:hypothetical protein n=1 Tax=Treponema vincentii TaxID=69710 RepID=UPI0020A4CEDD|nr:hypothetical protein [Treponema vincentii]UTC48664.1 hypothetical protein E4N73_07355 [Treponema vincentii]
MRKKRFVSMLSALILLIGITLVTAGCGQANGNTENNINQNNNGSNQRNTIEPYKQVAKALEPYAKFDGTFNTDKTELTIEKFPVIKDNLTVEVKEVVLKKK